jgi:hypothetical protein
MDGAAPHLHAALSPAARELAATLEPWFAPDEGAAWAEDPPRLTTPELLLEAGAVLLRCLVVLADPRAGAEEEAFLTASGAALFGDDQAGVALRRVIRHLRGAPLDLDDLGARLRAAFSARERKLLLLLAAEAAWADGVLRPAESERLERLQRSLAIGAAEAELLRWVARGDLPDEPPDAARGEAVAVAVADPAQRAVLAGLHEELSPSGFAALRGCPGLYRVVQSAHAGLGALRRATLPPVAPAGTAPELDGDQHAELRAHHHALAALGAHVVRLRAAAEGPELALAGGLLEALAAAHQRAAVGGLAVLALGRCEVGKSALLDALLGEALLPTGPAPCTAAPTVVRAGPRRQLTLRRRSRPLAEEPVDPARFAELAGLSPASDLDAADDLLAAVDLERLTLAGPFPFCRSGVQVVDTPGWRAHSLRAAALLRLARDADALLVVTNATRPPDEGEQALVARLLEDRPDRSLALVVTHADLLAPGEREALRVRLQDGLATLGARAERVRLHVVSATAGLAAVAQPPRPGGDPWLEPIEALRREVLAGLAGEGAPRRLARLRADLSRVSEEVHGLAAVRLAELARPDPAAAERDRDQLRRAAAALERELQAAGEGFAAFAADRCAQWLDEAVRRAARAAGGWAPDLDPRWPGNPARLRAGLEGAALRWFGDGLRAWSRRELPGMLLGTVSAVEAAWPEAVATLDRALAPLRAGAPADEEPAAGGAAPTAGAGAAGSAGGLRMLLRLGGEWPALGADGVLAATWPQVGLVLGDRLGLELAADLLPPSAPVGATVTAGVGLALLGRSRFGLAEKARAALLDSLDRERERLVAAARAVCVERCTGAWAALSARLRAGLRRVGDDAEARAATVRAGAAPGSAPWQRLERAQAACAAVSRALSGR